MCKVIAVCGYKGGVAKTTSAVNIGIGMADMGKKVLLIDMDAQGDMTKSLGVDNPEKLDKTIAEAIAASAELDEDEPGSFDPETWIMHNDEGVDFVPANNRLAAVEKQLVGEDGGDSILKIYVDSLRDDYDYIILDSKPAMVTLAANVLVAADTVIIPVGFISEMCFDTLKIDRSLLKRDFEDHRSKVVIESIIKMADSLGAKTVAEGVENTKQLSYLNCSGCTLLQGDFLSEPLPEHRFMDLLKAQNGLKMTG